MEIIDAELVAEVIISLSVFISTLVYCYINCCKKTNVVDEMDTPV